MISFLMQVSLVMAELGIELGKGPVIRPCPLIVSCVKVSFQVGSVQVPVAGVAESDLEKRLADLRKSDL